MNAEFIDALNNTKDTDSLIIDLRGNTGGLLDNAIFIADRFIENKKEDMARVRLNVTYFSPACLLAQRSV